MTLFATMNMKYEMKKVAEVTCNKVFLSTTTVY